MEKETVQDGDTLVSGSGSGSGISDLSILENETDTLGRQILQHERELRRAKTEVAEQPFWQARPKSWVTEQVTEESDGTTGVDKAGHHRRTASVGSAGSDPPLNVPREWGKRSRRRGSWLRRHESEGDAQLTGARTSLETAEQPDEDSIIPRRTMYTGDGWVAGDDVPQQSIEITPPPMRHLQRHASSPSSMHHMNTTLKSVETDDDFSGVSLLASTPVVNHSARKVDELMRKREIEAVKKRELTRRTLHHISEKYSHESLRPSTAPAVGTTRPARRRSSASNKENESDNEKEVTTKNNGKLLGLLDVASQPVTLKDPKRFSHTRQDSLKLLQRLARVSSVSPSPEKTVPDVDTGLIRRASDPLDNVAAPGLLGKERTDTKPQDERKPRVEFDLPAASSEPADTGGTSERSNQPSSALQEIIDNAKGGRDNQIGESTIASLENLVNPKQEESTDDLEAVDLYKIPQTSQNQNKNTSKHIDSAGESLAKQSRLTKLALTDTDHALRQLGDMLLEEISPEEAQYAEPYTDHNGRTICDHCGGRYTSVWRGLWVEFRENFFTWDAGSALRFRLTWLGALCLAWSSWLILESVLCSYYCHPRYAMSMEGYGVDPDAPEFPFVAPTLLFFRPLRAIWQPAGVFLAWLGASLLQAFLGGSSSSGGGGASSRSSQKKNSGAASSSYHRDMGGMGAHAAPIPAEPNPARFFARSAAASAGGEWLAAASVATASATRRIVGSTLEAADRFARMWEDGIGPS